MKKILSILLAGIITFSSMWLIPTSVNAAETTTNVQSSGVEKTGVPLQTVITMMEIVIITY